MVPIKQRKKSYVKSNYIHYIFKYITGKRELPFDLVSMRTESYNLLCHHPLPHPSRELF